MDRAEQFAALARLQALRRDAEASTLAVLRTKLRAVEGQIAELEKASVEPDPSGSDGPSAFQMSGRDQLWDVWRLSRLRELGLRAAGLRADIEAQTLQVRKAFGRHQVLDKLSDRVARNLAGRDLI